MRLASLAIIVRTSFRKCTPFLNSDYNFQFYGVLSLTCNNTGCGGIREPNAVAFSSCERSELPSLFNARAVYIYTSKRYSVGARLSGRTTDGLYVLLCRYIRSQATHRYISRSGASYEEPISSYSLELK